MQLAQIAVYKKNIKKAWAETCQSRGIAKRHYPNKHNPHYTSIARTHDTYYNKYSIIATCFLGFEIGDSLL